jgi:hypothetical protein
MKPTVRRLEQEFDGRVEFKSLNIDKSDTAEAKKKYNFIGQPQFVVLNSRDQVVSSRNGFQEYETLKADLEAALAGK